MEKIKRFIIGKANHLAFDKTGHKPTETKRPFHELDISSDHQNSTTNIIHLFYIVHSLCKTNIVASFWSSIVNYHTF